MLRSVGQSYSLNTSSGESPDVPQPNTVLVRNGHKFPVIAGSHLLLHQSQCREGWLS